MTALSPHAGRRILIVDDVPDNLSVLFDVLTTRGFQVFVADSGALAIEELAHTAPDLILLDVMMPGLDGFATCERIKANEQFADVPLFFLTALTDTVDKVKGFALGAVDYITKPLDPDEVVSRIQAHLDLRALRQALEERNEELDREIQRRLAAERLLQHSLEDALLVVDRSGEILFFTRAAQQLLARHGGLPDRLQLREWFEQPARFTRGGLTLKRLPNPTGHDRALFTLEATPSAASPEKLAVLGLTPRETEILFWIAQGKTSPEIAIILTTAPATVKRHVHHILGKLGVETRLAAALRATEILGGTG